MRLAPVEVFEVATFYHRLERKISSVPVNPMKERRMKRLAVVVAAIVFALDARGDARAQSQPTPDPDRAAVATIVMDSVREVQLCGLALEKSRNPGVQSFCHSAVNDHARMALQGMQLAQKLGASDVKLQASPGTPVLLETLNGYSGHDFDRAFLLAQIEDHEKDQDALRYVVEAASNASVRKYADAVLPRVENYLHLAEGALNSLSHEQP